MPSRYDLETRLQQWYWDQMRCGYYFYQYSVFYPRFLRTLLSLSKHSIQTRPYHINSLTRPILQHSPRLALSVFNLHYRQLAYVCAPLPFHVLYIRIFQKIHRIKDCTPREVFSLLIGMDLDALYTKLSSFFEALAPLLTAYKNRLLHIIPGSSASLGKVTRSVLLHAMNHYPVPYADSSTRLYHDLLRPLFHLIRRKGWTPHFRIMISSPSPMHFWQQAFSMTIPLTDRITIMLLPRSVRTHVKTIEKITSFSHELGHALQSDQLISHQHPLFQIDTFHPEVPALLFENIYTTPPQLKNDGLSPHLAHEIAFYQHLTHLLRCIKETGRAVMLLDCFRLPQLTSSSFRLLVQKYYRNMARVLGYPTKYPPLLNSYSLFYDVESVLAHWVTGVQTIEDSTDLGVGSPITTDFRPFLQKKWAFLHQISS